MPLIEAEITETMCGEDKLAGKAELVERVRPVLPEPGAMRVVVLPQEDVVVRLGPESRIL